MWLIKRVYMDGAGHEEAFYKDLTLDYIGLSQAVSSPVVEGLRSPVRNAKVVTSTYQQLVNGGGSPVVCYDLQPGRAVRYPEAWLHGWCGGTLVSDGYSVYKSLADNRPGVTSACCWSHARRGFANLYKASREPRAAMALRKIAGLYRIEKFIRERPVEKIRQWRQRYSRPIVNDLFAWLEEQELCCPPGRYGTKGLVVRWFTDGRKPRGTDNEPSGNSKT